MKELAFPQQEKKQLPSLASADAVVQRTLAEVQVAVMMAKTFPRDKITAKERLVNDCCREKLAEEATYVFSRGGTEVSGPSIRLAESAKNAWGNMQSGWRELSRNNGISEMEVFAWDVENNTKEIITFTVKHWRDTKQGGYALKDERDIYELCASQAKRRERACILNLIDGDIIDAAMIQVDETLTTKFQVTPDDIKDIIKAFEKFGVTKEQIEKRIQRRLDALNPPLMISLNKIHNSIKDGMSKPDDWFDIIEIVVADEKQQPVNIDKEKPIIKQDINDLKGRIASLRATHASYDEKEFAEYKQTEEYKTLWKDIKDSGNKELLGIMSGL